MGKSSGNQKVTQETKLPAWYETAAKDVIKDAGTTADNLAKPYQGNTVAGLDPLQTQAINLTGQNIGATNPVFSQAQGGATAAMNYNPQTVGNGYNAMMLGADYNPLQVSGGSFLTGDISRYMNPYIDNVEQAALRNMQQGYEQGLNTIADQAIGAGAFGGSRQGVAEGTAAAEFARQYGDLSANLRNQAYNAATDLAGQDLSRGMQAQLANQQTGLQGEQVNQQAMLANQDALYNQYALQQQAQLANQNAGLQGAQLNLQGSQSLGDLATAGQNAYLQSLQSALAAGQINQDQAQALLAQDAARYDAMRNYPLEQLNINLAALGGTQVPTSTTTTRPTSGNWLTGAAGGALAGAPMGIPGMIAGGLLGGLASR